MKNLLLLLLALCLPASAATFRPIVTSSTNYVVPFSTTGTNLVTLQTTAEMLSFLGATGGGATNGIQMLNGIGTNPAIYGITIYIGLTNQTLTASELIATDANKKVVSLPVATNASITELSYLKGVSSALQTQLDDKGSLTGLNTLSNAVTAVSNSVVTVSNSMATITGLNTLSNAVTAVSNSVVTVSNSVTTVQNTLATNTALLNGTNVFAGTNSITGKLIASNAENVVVARSYLTTQQTAAYATGTNVTVSATNNLHFLTLTNTTYFPAPSGLAVGCSFTVIIQQDATGSRAVTFDTNYWKFPSGTQPTITTNASAYDVISCISCPFGTNVFAVVNQYFR